MDSDLGPGIAQWPTSPDPQNGVPSGYAPWPTWKVWQYADNTTVPGISGNVDGDVFNGTSNQMVTTLLIIGGTQRGKLP